MKDSKILDLLVLEYKDAGGKINSYLQQGERALTIGVTLLSLVVTAAVVDDRSYVLIGAPLCYSLILAYVIHLNGEAVSLGGYKAALETRINELASENLFIWESHVARKRHMSLPTMVMRSFSVLALLSFSGGAVFEAILLRRSDHGSSGSTALLALTVASIVVGIAILGLGVRSELASHGKVNQLASDLLGK